MNLKVKARNVLRGLRLRWGTAEIKRKIWDVEYAGGRWTHCEHSPDAPVYRFVETYCRNGSILDLGCGSGNTGNELQVTNYQTYTGVDVSEVAVEKAAKRSASNGRGAKNRYLVSDIESFMPPEKYDVILFRESLYYVPLLRVKTTLERYLKYLTDTGVFVVNISSAGTDQIAKYVQVIENSFRVIEKSSPKSSDVIVVFR